MVRIRLRRMGAKKKPFYRIVVANQRSPRDGRFIETVGTYNPLTQPETVTLVRERIAHWVGVGAQPSDSVARVLRTHNVLDENNKLIPFEEADEVTESSEAAANTSEPTEPSEAAASTTEPAASTTEPIEPQNAEEPEPVAA